MNRSSRAGMKRREALSTLAVVGTTALAIVLMTAGALWISNADGEPDRGRQAGAVLAVMPFTSVESDPEVASFGVGLADAITSRLSASPGLVVRPMSATLGALAAAPDPLQAGRRLHATVVMLGECQQTRDQYEVSVRLIDTGTGATIWKGDFRSNVSDLMQAERAIVKDSLAAMMPDLRDMESARLVDAGRRDGTSHYLYLLARGKIATWQSAPIPEAVELLEQAISLDPDFAPAQAELSTASANMFLGGISSDPAWIARALAAGRRAVTLDDRSAPAHAALGNALLLAGDPVASTRETILALRLNPGDASALRALASLIAGAGHAEPVRALRDAARRADPTIELGWLDVWLAMIEGQYDRGMGELRHEVDSRSAAGQSPELP
ncbi:MAG TPA: hypothetical protein VFE84_11380, partial [Patescibacteria group bacterium]|nr:hypothetical protein [Patescibacteria group bacterium]